MASLVTKDVFTLTKAAGETAVTYSEDEIKKLLDEENLEIIREEQWLEDVYGAQSRLENSRWLEKVSTVGHWVFNPIEFRRRIFA